MEKADYKITEFHNSEFGSIRMIEDGGRLLFSGIDVAFALGYAKPRNAINVHCKGALKRGVLTSGGVQPMIFIPEGDVYRLITKSRLKSAQNFEKWVFDEVLPAIRKTGGYLETDLLDRVKDNPELLLEFAERLLAENNRNRELQNRVNDMQPKGYKYNHHMKIEFAADNKRLGQVLYALAHSSLRPEFSIEYTVADVEKCKNELLHKAIEDSIQKAQVLTTAANVKLGEIQAIDYSWGEIDFVTKPLNEMRLMECTECEMSAPGAYDIDIEADDINVIDTATVIWEIA